MLMTGWSIALALTAQGGAAATRPLASTPPLICKRTTLIGSMHRKRRECRSRAVWDRIAEAARAHTVHIIDPARQGGAI